MHTPKCGFVRGNAIFPAISGDLRFLSHRDTQENGIGITIKLYWTQGIVTVTPKSDRSRFARNPRLAALYHTEGSQRYNSASRIVS
jgi:hypothetical protein